MIIACPTDAMIQSSFPEQLIFQPFGIK